MPKKTDYILASSATDDITFCTASCKRKCARKPSCVKQPEYPHSFSDFSEVCASFEQKEKCADASVGHK